MIRIDTNYIIRYFMNDNVEMADEAEKVFRTKKVFVANEIIAEVVYVLEGVYNIPKEIIIDLLKDFFQNENILVENKEILYWALDIFKNKNLDFVDCFLCAYSKKDEILTFDKKLSKCIKNLKK